MEPARPPPKNGTTDDCFSYLPSADADPYFQIAEGYGFANYMFQTNEGPSYPAHQFLFSGTAAPTQYNNGNYKWFLLDNVVGPLGYQGDVNCASNSWWSSLIDQNGNCAGGDCGYVNEQSDPTTWCYDHNSGDHCTKTCFDHNSLVSLYDQYYPGPPYGWQYYTPPGGSGKGHGNSYWNAPGSIKALYGTNEYNSQVITYSDPKTVLGAIDNCNLTPIAYVIPDASLSDHAGECTTCGPSWVATIVNHVGQNTTCGTDKKGYWNNDPQHSTAIFITWDDWGGWFDHINPDLNHYPGVNKSSTSWGAYDTYGFRVPLLVVSPYTPAGMVSGACGGQGQVACPNQSFPFVHDFGSILAFIENNYGLPLPKGGIFQGSPNNTYAFADYHAPDNQGTNIPLQEFFETNNTVNSWRSFTPITTNPACGLTNMENQLLGYGPDGNDTE